MLTCQGKYSGRDQFRRVPCEPNAVVPHGARVRVDVHFLWADSTVTLRVLLRAGECATGTGEEEWGD